MGQMRNELSRSLLGTLVSWVMRRLGLRCIKEGRRGEGSGLEDFGKVSRPQQPVRICTVFDVGDRPSDPRECPEQRRVSRG